MVVTNQIDYAVNGKEITIKFSGHFNHFIEIEKDRLKGFKTVNVDFNDVKLMNSLGIKKWFDILANLEPDVIINYYKIPPNIVIQMSLVVGFLPKMSNVISFYAPYYDKVTKEGTLVLLTPDQIQDGKAPEAKNEKGEELFLDAIEEIYFSFLSKKQEK